MADRFPSIEDFDEGDTEVKGPAADGLDTEDDFLARERAALGDDAAQFADAPPTQQDENNDLLGGDHNNGPITSDEQAAFESSFPTISTETNAGNSSNAAFHDSTYQSFAEDEEEPQVIKDWRERRDLALQHRAEQAEKKKEATIKEAQAAIDDFYENYNNKKEKTISQTRKEAEEFLASRDSTTAGGTSWERIAKLVDLSGKGSRGGAAGTGKEKFRELLTELRKDQTAPGASGVKSAAL